MNTNKTEKTLSWVALILTTGEFGIALFLIFHDGHLLALYLAVTYLLRETNGGRHYHDIIVNIWRKYRKN